jgi:hypothetical protein
MSGFVSAAGSCCKTATWRLLMHILFMRKISALCAVCCKALFGINDKIRLEHQARRLQNLTACRILATLLFGV